MIHLIKEEHQKEFCPYCGTNLSKEKWVSEFHLEHHYKTLLCPKCKKQISLKVDFHGSGHDEWSDEWHSLITKNTDACLKELEMIVNAKMLNEKIIGEKK